MRAFKYTANCQEKNSVEVIFSKKQLFVQNTYYSYKSISFKHQKEKDDYLLYLYDGQILECQNTHELQKFIIQNENSERFNSLKVFGIKFGIILPAIIILIALIYGSYNFFLPTISKSIAMEISQEKAYAFGEDALKTLEENYLQPSTLSATRQNALQQKFQERIKNIKDLPKIEIIFRSSKELGANAFALPSATVILLDELVALSANEDEIFAIVAHELGHIYHRHILRQLMQDSVLYIGLVFATGDITSLATVVGFIPVILLRQHYSKDFEREADIYAYNLLKKQNINPLNFISMLKKIIQSHKPKEKQSFYYLSSHPDIQEREKIFFQ
ncbi:MAG: M48 family metallopeptidase [Sulfurimonas sp.]|jgi:Zn-dependent protease with chaperone function